MKASYLKDPRVGVPWTKGEDKDGLRNVMDFRIVISIFKFFKAKMDNAQEKSPNNVNIALSKNFTMTLLLHQSPISPHSLKTLFYS
jgi:hypothetical protein